MRRKRAAWSSERARQSGTFVRIDMEGTPHTDRTLAVVDELRRSSDWVGVVLQAYLYRSEQDLVRLTKRARASGCAKAPTKNRPTRPSQKPMSMPTT